MALVLRGLSHGMFEDSYSPDLDDIKCFVIIGFNFCNLCDLIGQLGRQCYAVFCLGVLLITVAIAHYACADQELNDHNHNSNSKRHLHGPPLLQRQS